MATHEYIKRCFKVGSNIVTACDKHIFLGATSRLPEGYQEVEYIESSGTQYIDTGIIAQADTRAVLDIQLTSSTAWQNPFGSDAAGTTYYTAQITDAENTMRFIYAVNSTSNNVSVTYTDRHLYDYNNTGHTFNIDGELKKTISDSFTASDKNVYLFAYCNRSGVAGSFTSMKCYGFKLYSAYTTIIQNLVPAIRLSDNEVGMYDTVTSTFFTNQGTGTFTAGPNKYVGLPDAYEELEYIVGSGTQYILPDIIRNDLNWYFEEEVMVDENTTSSAFMGNETTYNSRVALAQWANHKTTYLYGNKSWQDKVALPYNTWSKVAVDCATKVITFGSNTYTASGTVSEADTVRWGVLERMYYSTPTQIANGVKLRYFLAKHNDVLIAKLIPAKRLSDSAIGMYDIVTDTFYANAGTGVFTAGPAVVKNYTCRTRYYLEG